MPSAEQGQLKLHFLSDFSRLSPNDQRLEGVGLLCVDLENIFVPLGGNDVKHRDTARVAEHLNAGRIVVGLTNMTDHDRAQVVADKLGMSGVIAKGMLVDPSGQNCVLRSKSHPDMFEHAVDAYGFGSAGSRAVLVDDQLKNARGAAQVSKFTDFFWTFPNYLLKQHPGVAAFRPAEVLLGFGLIGLQRLGESHTRR